jgi:hypothetical protein
MPAFGYDLGDRKFCHDFENGRRRGSKSAKHREDDDAAFGLIDRRASARAAVLRRSSSPQH